MILAIGGTADSIGMTCALYAASIGISGISFAVANTDCIYVILFNYLFRSQAVTLAQVAGIALTLGGASVIALEKQIKGLLGRGEKSPVEGLLD